jgi:1-acyl-sn-glycerol-3-phosphate acyltransferase
MKAALKARLTKWPFFGPLGSDYESAWARTAIARAVRFVMLETITKPAVRMVARPRVVSCDRVQNLQSPVIFVVNHSSHLDTSLILSSLPRRLRNMTLVAAGTDYFFDKHWKAALWSLWMGIIPLERDKISRQSIDISSRLLHQGWNLVVYAEGTRGKTYFSDPFKPGAAFLSIRANVPVVPMHLEGSRRLMPPYTRHLRIGKTRVTFGAPLYPMPDEKPRDFNVRIETAVALAADEGRTDWWSAQKRAAAGKTPSLRAPDGLGGWRLRWAGTSAGEANRPR